MKVYNIIDPEELISGKMEFDSIKSKIEESKGKEYKKLSLEDFLSTLDFTKTIFIHNNNNDIKVIPYVLLDVGEEKILFYSKNADEDVNKNFDYFISNLNKVEFTPKTTAELLANNLKNPLPEKYVMINNEIHTWEIKK